MMTSAINTDFELPVFADHPAMHQFLAAWNVWRGDAIIPNRRHVQLNDISSAMSHTMMFDMVSPAEIMCRFMGSVFMDIYARDFTGHNYLHITQPEFRETRSKRLFAIVNHPCAAVWEAKTDLGGGKTGSSVGVSVPIAPTSDDAPMQLMQTLVFSVDVPKSEYGKPSRFRHVEFSTRFETIDIGAGHPDL